MTGLTWVGPDVVQDDEVVYKAYVDSLKANDASLSHVDQVISSNLSNYATKSYVDQRDSLLATKSYVDLADNQRLKLSFKNIANGVVGLNASGKIINSLINIPSAETYVRGPWSPAAYPSTTTEVSTETTLYSCPITDPGYVYKPVVFGITDLGTLVDGVFPKVVVRQGNETTGAIVAQGVGVPVSYPITDDFERTSTVSLGSDWNTTYPGGAPSNSTWSTSDGHSAKWSRVINDTKSYTAASRRVNSQDMTTSGDYQHVKFKITSFTSSGDFFTQYNTVDMYGRWSVADPANPNYVMFRFNGANKIQLYYRSGTGSLTQLGSDVSCPMLATSVYEVYWGVKELNQPRRFRVFVDGSMIVDYVDSGNVTSVSNNHRGWGFGSVTNSREFAGVEELTMIDPLTDSGLPTAEVPLMPYDVANLPSITGATTLYIRLTTQGNGSVRALPFNPHLYVQALPI